MKLEHNMHLCVCTQVLLDGRTSVDEVTAGSSMSLKPRLLTVLIGALQTETDATNTQIILGQFLILNSVYTLKSLALQ